MNKIFRISALILSIFASNESFASESTNSLGFAAGGTYGIGLSYSYDTSVWGVQVTGLPIWDQEDGGQVFGGVNFKRNFHENGIVGLYGSVGVGGGFWRDQWENCDWDSETDEENCWEEVEEGWGVIAGPGVGMQVIFMKNMLFRFELPLGARFSSEGFGISPIPNAAIMYRW
jgi:hypothetical protein